jgi:hypothetical protein
MHLSKSYKKRLKSLSGIISEGISSLQELDSEDVSIPTSYTKDSLNQKIWDGVKLRPEIREHLLKIAAEYVKYLEIDVEPEKIMFLGSMANYNWNEFSDLDLHLVYDFKRISNDVQFAKDFFDTKGANWKSNHKITIKGYDVEIYVQEKDEKNKSVGVYDLTNDDWISKPKIEDVKIDRELIKKKAASIATRIERIEKLSKENSNWNKVHKEAKKLKDKIKRMRQSGLDKTGEFSAENLAFKYLRNNGYLERLGNVSSESFDKSLSIDEVMSENYNKKVEMENEPIDEKSNSKHKLVIKKSVDNIDSDKMNLIKEFIIMCCDELSIDSPCIVYFTGERGGPITTTASYNPNNDHIWIYTKNRNMLADPLRSLAHEIRHFKQKLDGVLNEKSGEDGSPHENEANSFSGYMIRKFGKQHREIYK